MWRSLCLVPGISAWPCAWLVRVCLVLGLLVGSAPGVQAVVPRTIALRGVVTERGTGSPLNRTETVLLTLYDTALGRTRVLW